MTRQTFFAAVARYVLFLLVFAFFVFSACRAIYYYGNQISSRALKPKLFCELSSYDFGTITFPNQPSHAFILKNQGWNELSIQSVSPGCGSCVKVVDYTQTPIQYGQAGMITLALLTDHLQGEVIKEVLVQTNDPKQPKLILTLKAEVVRPESNESSEVSANP